MAASFQMLESRQDRGKAPTPTPSATQDTQNQNFSADAHETFAKSEPMNIQDDNLPF